MYGSLCNVYLQYKSFRSEFRICQWESTSQSRRPLAFHSLPGRQEVLLWRRRRSDVSGVLRPGQRKRLCRREWPSGWRGWLLRQRRVSLGHGIPSSNQNRRHSIAVGKEQVSSCTIEEAFVFLFSINFSRLALNLDAHISKCKNGFHQNWS